MSEQDAAIICDGLEAAPCSRYSKLEASYVAPRFSIVPAVAIKGGHLRKTLFLMDGLVKEVDGMRFVSLGKRA